MKISNKFYALGLLALTSCAPYHSEIREYHPIYPTIIETDRCTDCHRHEIVLYYNPHRIIYPQNNIIPNVRYKDIPPRRDYTPTNRDTNREERTKGDRSNTRRDPSQRTRR
nr:hypothetical protein [Nanoarchaeum sp.]